MPKTTWVADVAATLQDLELRLNCLAGEGFEPASVCPVPPYLFGPEAFFLVIARRAERVADAPELDYSACLRNGQPSITQKIPFERR